MPEPDKSKSFQEAASEKPRGLGAELVDMLKQNKKWWIIPILCVLALFGVLLALGSTSAAPFIYTLF